MLTHRAPSALFGIAALLCGGASAQEAPRETPAVRYFLPFAPGSTFRIWQGNDQPPSHDTRWARYAFDFSPLAEATPIHAAASGSVVYVKEDTAEPTGNFSDNNEIAILHADGNVSTYLHLRAGGALVQVGDLVLRGDLIGWSGNTGKSTAPHLCFGLRRGHRLRGDSVPVRFVDVAGDGVPETDDSVRSANHPLRPWLGAAIALQQIAPLAARVGGGHALGAAVASVGKAVKRRVPEPDAALVATECERALAAAAAAEAATSAQPPADRYARAIAKALTMEHALRTRAAGLTDVDARRLIKAYQAAVELGESTPEAAAAAAHVESLRGYLPAQAPRAKSGRRP